MDNILEKFNRIQESRGKPIVVIDVQPEYYTAARHEHDTMIEYVYHQLSQQNDIYYIFNEFDGMETEEKLQNWLAEKMFEIDYDEEIYDLVYDITFIPKEYAFLRHWMDIGVYPEDISAVCKYMIKNRINDTRDFDVDNLPDEIIKILEDYDLDDLFDGDSIYIHEIFDESKRLPNSFELIGGGINECLAEMEIVFDTIKKRYKINHRYTY